MSIEKLFEALGGGAGVHAVQTSPQTLLMATALQAKGWDNEQACAFMASKFVFESQARLYRQVLHLARDHQDAAACAMLSAFITFEESFLQLMNRVVETIGRGDLADGAAFYDAEAAARLQARREDVARWLAACEQKAAAPATTHAAPASVQ